MSRLLLPFLILIFPLAISAQSNSWRGLTPLHSTVEDVEKMLGKPEKINSWGTSEYKVDGGRVYITFSKKRCDKGWDVAKDTVLEIGSSDKYIGKTAEDLGLVEGQQFEMRTDEGNHTSWIDPIKGLGYDFSTGPYGDRFAFVLDSISYRPMRSDNNLRCNGFAPFTPERDYFTMDTPEFFNQHITLNEALFTHIAQIDNTMVHVLSSEGKRVGYAIVYFDRKRPFSFYKKQLERLKVLLRQRRKKYDNKFFFIEGGLREESEIRFYILSKDLPPPSPNPTLPSPQFMKKPGR